MRDTITIEIDPEIRKSIADAIEKAGRGMKKNAVYARILRKGLGIKIDGANDGKQNKPN